MLIFRNWTISTEGEVLQTLVFLRDDCSELLVDCGDDRIMHRT